MVKEYLKVRIKDPGFYIKARMIREQIISYLREAYLNTFLGSD